MTTKLDQALETLRRLPEKRQDEWAEIITETERAAPAYTPEQLAAIDEGMADAKAGRFVSDEEVAALFARFRPE